ncbi:hypothetical protein [Pseudooceanicola nanhaiensis]|uniref:hypothetical protein n=1 Tax=Pseudooceanicola nanhaiensis TaxID=375761 RepID=UPI001CD38F38|nr:hypothetical protein [Pseudooceanicola nanhaiensis]MCA0920164.1 hypothetical protein [Pseudooceanicola nanhaiensis]
MILCSCNRLTCSEVRAATAQVLDTGAAEEVSPGRVFRLCGRTVCCGACSSLINRTITDHAAAVRAGAS